MRLARLINAQLSCDGWLWRVRSSLADENFVAEGERMKGVFRYDCMRYKTNGFANRYWISKKRCRFNMVRSGSQREQSRQSRERDEREGEAVKPLPLASAVPTQTSPLTLSFQAPKNGCGARDNVDQNHGPAVTQHSRNPGLYSLRQRTKVSDKNLKQPLNLSRTLEARPREYQELQDAETQSELTRLNSRGDSADTSKPRWSNFYVSYSRTAAVWWLCLVVIVTLSLSTRLYKIHEPAHVWWVPY